MLIIAHRGDTTHYPENTIEAFKSALELGAGGIELDVQLLDGKLIVVHDFLFDRRKSYPKLEQVVKQFWDQGRMEIEIKSFDTEILKHLKQILGDYPRGDFELTTSETPLAIHVKEAFPKLKLGLIFKDFLFEDWMTEQLVTQKIIGWAKTSKANVVHLSYKAIEQFGKKRLVQYLQKNNLLVHSHIFKGKIQELRNIEAWRVDQCTIDDLSLL